VINVSSPTASQKRAGGFVFVKETITLLFKLLSHFGGLNSGRSWAFGVVGGAKVRQKGVIGLCSGSGGRTVHLGRGGEEIRWLPNMNMPRSLKQLLESVGHQCRHTGEIGLERASDVEFIHYP
jgi:hypothetical protein